MVMAMLNQLFGSNNVKTSSELRSVGKRKHDPAIGEEHGVNNMTPETHSSWGTDSKEALRVPILANAHKKHSNSGDAGLPAFGHHARKNKYQLSESNPYGVEIDNTVQTGKTTQLTLVPVIDSSNASTVKTLGVFSKSVAYKNQIQTLLACYDLNIKVFGPADKDALIDRGADISVWVIDLSDEEDCPVLDLLLDKYGNVESLFLFESTPSSKCISKLKSFAHNIELERIDLNELD
jgi:hypothetical protein